MFADLKALAKGFWTTLRHMGRPVTTVRYPEQKRPGSANFKGRHRLYRYDNGLERCIGCHLCAAACPSQAIYVGAEENDPKAPVSFGERYARHFEINMLRCIFCGFCEEACPVEAIRLGPEYELADYHRHSLVYTKEMLLDPEQHAPKRQYHADVDRPRGPLGGLPDQETGVSGAPPGHRDTDTGARPPLKQVL
ncbi:MAG TPA: NADH-quinone oxidoreductase subunit NuoI [Planctomycetota bacterium]|nr:NADH-quinone oxidoreductase subunit NuoI [Planctomycetota bacterium]